MLDVSADLKKYDSELLPKKIAEENSRAIAINRPSEYEEQNPNFRLQIL